MQGCDITSGTGSGVGLEGGQLTVSGCRIHQCKQHGIALFNSLEDVEGTALIREWSIDPESRAPMDHDNLNMSKGSCCNGVRA